MSTRTVLSAAALLATGVLLGWPITSCGAQETDPEISFTAAQLAERTLHRRAVEATIWDMQIVSVDAMRQAFLRDEKHSLNAYSVNNITATRSADGSTVIQFGGCDGKIPNCLTIEKGWDYMVRLYRPRAEILNGTWTFPEAQPVQ